jgi:hypothetical protein
MKKVTIIVLTLAFSIIKGFAQSEKTKHFEIDAMVGMHSYSSSFFHAINSVTWIQDPPSNVTEFSGYGTSILPAVQISYIFDNNIGIATGIVPITADNELFVEDETGTNYDFCVDQFNVNLGIVGRIQFSTLPVSINTGSGLMFSPFDISESIESNSGGSYLEGSDWAAGYYANASFQIRIVSFLRFKTQFTYSFIPASITLYDNEGNIEQNIHNLNVGGITLKTGLSFQL